MSRVWLVTGASAGLGEAIALKALEAGDRVIATSRSVSRLERLKSRGAAPLALDHNQSQASIQAAVDQAIAIYGTIDVVVNNAAYVQLGTLEETTYAFPLLPLSPSPNSNLKTAKKKLRRNSSPTFSGP